MQPIRRESLVRASYLALTLGLGLSLTAAAVVLADLKGAPQLTYGQAVAHTVCLVGPPLCDHADLQAAVDAAQPGDEIRVAAGVYSDLHMRNGITQVVYLSKSLTLRGGFVPPDWITPDPAALTVLDAGGLGRAVVISGEATSMLSGLVLVSGDATGLGGYLSAWGGPMHDVGGALYVLSATVQLSETRLISSGATYGGAAFFHDASIQVLGSQVISSVASAGGGLYFVNCPEVRLSGSLLSGNVANGTGTSDGGGAAYLIGSVGMLDANTMVANQAALRGGAAYLAGGDILLRENTMNGNRTEGYGGAVYMAGGTPELVNNTIISNTATQYGGGICVRWADAIIRGNTVSYNEADGSGGLDVAFGDFVRISDNLFEGNRAVKECGGGLHFSAYAGVIERNIFRNNLATLNGGGFACCTTNVLAVGNVLVGNSTVESGGGIYVSNSRATLLANQMLSNTAGLGGGLGIREASVVTAVNTLAANNRAIVEGGGIYVDSSALRAQHTTLAANFGPDGVCVTRHSGDPSSASFVNTILVGHSLAVTVSEETAATFAYTLWGAGDWENAALWSGDGTFTMDSHNFWSVPGFTAPGDYHLTLGSAAVDRASAIGVTVDVDGQARPHYAASDLGADELWLVDAAQSAAPTTVHTGDRLTYTLALTAPATSASVCITDVLHPLTLLAGPLLYETGSGGAVGSTVTWCGDLARGQSTTLTWPVTLAPGITERTWFLNGAQVRDPLGTFWVSPAGVWAVPYEAQLPLVLRLLP